MRGGQQEETSCKLRYTYMNERDLGIRRNIKVVVRIQLVLVDVVLVSIFFRKWIFKNKKK